ncbi:hypothetical protein [Sphingobium yanoikuyae]|uniref:Uncharacterized protein n=1 Tax=Sphingobium yanoikuyae TaxID=13690 RepID=A0A9X7U985_SPHYA|nr:hypothetical protein [Sphingobium yanoikuyae]QNG46128.1 hypothetical protein H3V42_00110 [Sphingobium yanoikuyae]
MGTFFILLACSAVAFTIGIGVGGLFTVLRIDRHNDEALKAESEAQ